MRARLSLENNSPIDVSAWTLYCLKVGSKPNLLYLSLIYSLYVYDILVDSSWKETVPAQAANPD